MEDGVRRTYFLYVPEELQAPAPLLLLLHGSGRDGMSQINEWKALADRQGVILVAPNSENSAQWSFPTDGPEFLHDVIEAIRRNHKVDARRIYLFGHSAGAIFALEIGILESEYFAAVAVHAGALRDDFSQYMEHADRKLPIAIWVGTRDPLFPLESVRKTREMLTHHGFPVEMHEMNGHDHDYYAVSGQVNPQVWGFLGKIKLDEDPSWEQYRRR